MKFFISLALGATMLLPILTTSCREKGEVVYTKIDKTPPPVSPSSSHQGNPPHSASSNIVHAEKNTYSWTLPEGWSDQPASGMRLGTIIIPTAANTLKASVTEFGGDIAGNVNRWRQQIGLPSIPESQILPNLKTFDTPLGKEGKGYMVSLINPESPDKALLAAIIPRPSGRSIFVKVTGKADELKTIATPFLMFTQSLK